MIETTSSYWPFGYPLRGWQLQAYRFGFQGQEKDPEWTGQQGSHLDFGARIYDSRIGRWLAVDPLAAKFPEASPYCFVKNMPTIAVDPDGKEPDIVNKVLKSRDQKQGYKVVIDNKSKEITIFKTEASFNKEKSQLKRIRILLLHQVLFKWMLMVKLKIS